jgi:hypothetical protein
MISRKVDSGARKIRSAAADWFAATTLDRPEGILAERTQVKNISFFNAR